MLTVMSWNVENFFTPATGDQDAYEEKVAELAAVITAAAPDLVALQEVGDPESFETLRTALGAGWTGVLSTHFEPSHAIRVGWLSPGDLTEVEEVVDLPTALSPVKVADDGTTITQLGRGALAVTYTTTAGTKVRVLTCHLKSKLLSLPRRPVRHHRRDRAGPLRRLRPGPPGRRGRRCPGLGHHRPGRRLGRPPGAGLR